MGLSFSSLVGGITKGAAQAQQGIANRRELEQKALHEALLRRLTEAQVSNYESLAQERMAPPPRKRAAHYRSGESRDPRSGTECGPTGYTQYRPAVR
jgi:hypothetical protein